MCADAVIIEKLYKDFFPALCVFTFQYTRDIDVARDICQDAFLYIWKKKIFFSTTDAAKSYLFKYVRNRALNYLRDKKAQNEKLLELAFSDAYFRDILIETEAYDILYKAVVLLPKQGQRIINLTLDGLKNHEIAARLGISENTVKTLKRKAYKSLRIEMGGNALACLVLFEHTRQDKK
ncbi:MAG: sigma-70 family RNA polymerase sigma factor [Mangrovibacterium sp.]